MSYDIAMARERIGQFLEGCSEETKQEIMEMVELLGTEAVAMFLDEVEDGTA